jgi:hypothetical protein
MELFGRIKFIDETRAFGANGFRKREVVITTDEQYPQHILVEFTQDKCDVLNSYKVGEAVKIGINLRGREWVNPQGETKYFNTIQAWNINRQNNQQPAPQEQQQTYQAEPYQENPDEEHDDLPF